MANEKQPKTVEYPNTDKSLNEKKGFRKLLEESVFEALKLYSNIHRGSGHKSNTTTAMFEHCRHIVLDYLGLRPGRYEVIFCSPYLAEAMKNSLNSAKYHILSSNSYGLSIGVRALVVKKGALPRGVPPINGGGTAKLVSAEWVIWAKPPMKFEAGTQAIINVIAFSKALQLMKKYGDDIFTDPGSSDISFSELLHTGKMDGLQGKDLLNELRKTRIGLGLKVPVINGEKDFINFDSSASTPTFTPVWDTFRRGIYLNGLNGKEIADGTRKICSDFLGAPLKDFEIFFTSNTTESINIVARSLDKSVTVNSQPVVACTLMEHSSNDLPWRTIPGHSVIRIAVDKNGFINHQELEELLEDYNSKEKYGTKRVSLVVISGASNVLGTCNDLKSISNIVHKYKAKLLVDGAQLVAHKDAEVEKCEIDYFVFSAHKIYAPFGCGVLAVRKGLINFSSQEKENILLSGEENTAGIAALGKMLSLLDGIGFSLIEKEERALAARLLSEMDKMPRIRIVGIRAYDEESLAKRVAVIPFYMRDKVSFRIGKELAFYKGIGVRVGCHCAHILVKYVLNVGPGLEKFQRVLQTIIPTISFPGVVRVSVGIENTEKEVEELLKGLKMLQIRSKGEKPDFSGKAFKKMMSDFTNDCVIKVFGPNNRN